MNVPVLRVARPSDRLEEVVTQYRQGLELEVLASFEDHDGFDGVILGHPNAPYHLEFTRRAGHPSGDAPTQDNLLVFYLPETSQWGQRCAAMRQAGFRECPSFNPYWDHHGKTFEDTDGYRVVIQNAAWGA